MPLDDDAVYLTAERLYKRFKIDMGLKAEWCDATEDDRAEWCKDVRLVLRWYELHRPSESMRAEPEAA